MYFYYFIKFYLIFFAPFLKLGCLLGNPDMKSMHTAIPFFEGYYSKYQIDPARLPVGEVESFISQTFYSKLIDRDFNNAGEFVSGLAEKFYWREDTLVIELRDSFLLSDGKPINASDILFHFERLLELGQFEHDLFRYCKENCKKSKSNFSIKRVSDRIVEFTFPQKSELVLQYLSSAKFHIVPKRAIGPDGLTVNDHRITTGPYRLERRAGDFIAEWNSQHWSLVSDKSPQSILITSDRYSSNGIDPISRELFLSGQLDFIPLATIGGRVDKLHNPEKSKTHLHITNDLHVIYWFFTDKGMQIPADDRALIAVNIQKQILKSNEKIGRFRQPKSQLYRKFAFGSLSTEQMSNLQSRSKRLKGSKMPRTVVAATLQHAVGHYREVFRGLSGLEVVGMEDNVSAVQLDINSTAKLKIEPDLVMSMAYISPYEDIETISDLVRRNHFSVRGPKAERWLERYAQESNARKRELMLRSLHYLSVYEDISIVPLFTLPNDAISQNGWEMDFNPVYHESPVWRVWKK